MEKELWVYLAVAVIIAFLISRWMFEKFCVNNYNGDGQNKYVLITGCDSGFGKETAIRLDCLGFYVFATCLTSEGEQHLKMTCSKRVTTLRLDVRNSEQITETFSTIAQSIPENTGKLLIVCAGLSVLF